MAASNGISMTATEWAVLTDTLNVIQEIALEGQDADKRLISYDNLDRLGDRLELLQTVSKIARRRERLQ